MLHEIADGEFLGEFRRLRRRGGGYARAKVRIVGQLFLEAGAGHGMVAAHRQIVVQFLGVGAESRALVEPPAVAAQAAHHLLALVGRQHAVDEKLHCLADGVRCMSARRHDREDAPFPERLAQRLEGGTGRFPGGNPPQGRLRIANERLVGDLARHVLEVAERRLAAAVLRKAVAFFVRAHQRVG